MIEIELYVYMKDQPLKCNGFYFNIQYFKLYFISKIAKLNSVSYYPSEIIVICYYYQY